MKYRTRVLGLLIASVGLVFWVVPTYKLSQARAQLELAMLDSIKTPSAPFYTSIDSLETVSRFPGFHTVASGLIVNSTLRWQGRYMNSCEGLLDAAVDTKRDALRLEQDLANKNAVTAEERRLVSTRSHALEDNLRADRLAHCWLALGMTQERHNSFCRAWHRFRIRFANSPSICRMCRYDMRGSELK